MSMGIFVENGLLREYYRVTTLLVHCSTAAKAGKRYWMPWVKYRLLVSLRYTVLATLTTHSNASKSSLQHRRPSLLYPYDLQTVKLYSICSQPQTPPKLNRSEQ